MTIEVSSPGSNDNGAAEEKQGAECSPAWNQNIDPIEFQPINSFSNKLDFIVDALEVDQEMNDALCMIDDGNRTRSYTPTILQDTLGIENSRKRSINQQENSGRSSNGSIRRQACDNERRAVVVDDVFKSHVDKSVLQECQMNSGKWTADEHELFLEGLEKFGKNWKSIASEVTSRTLTQIRTHAQKYFLKLEKMNGGGTEKSCKGTPKKKAKLTKKSQPKRKVTPRKKNLKKKNLLQNDLKAPKSFSTPLTDEISVNANNIIGLNIEIDCLEGPHHPPYFTPPENCKLPCQSDVPVMFNRQFSPMEYFNSTHEIPNVMHEFEFGFGTAEYLKNPNYGGSVYPFKPLQFATASDQYFNNKINGTDQPDTFVDECIQKLMKHVKCQGEQEILDAKVYHEKLKGSNFGETPILVPLPTSKSPPNRKSRGKKRTHTVRLQSEGILPVDGARILCDSPLMF